MVQEHRRPGCRPRWWAAVAAGLVLAGGGGLAVGATAFAKTQNGVDTVQICYANTSHLYTAGTLTLSNGGTQAELKAPDFIPPNGYTVGAGFDQHFC